MTLNLHVIRYFPVYFSVLKNFGLGKSSMESMIHNEVDALCTELRKDAETLGHSR